MTQVILPDPVSLLARLTAVDRNPHLREHFYPMLLRAAGQERTPEGIGTLLMLSVADYTRDMQLIMCTVMMMRVWQFVPAFTDDPVVQREVLAFLAEAGGPAGTAHDETKETGT